MPTGTITKRSVDAFAPQAKQAVLWDAKVKGFGLLVLPSGSKSYVFQFRIGGRSGRLRRYTIGKHGSPWSPDQARKRAEDLAECVRNGIDPIDLEREQLAAKESAKLAAAEAVRQAQDLEFGAYANRFVDIGLKPDTRDRTREGYKSALANHVTPLLVGKSVAAVTRSDIVSVIDRIPASQPSVRRLTFAVARKLFNWAKSRGDIEASPMEGIEAPAPVASRDRVLTDEELSLALRAADEIEAPFGPFYRILFATGQRRDEVAGIRWSELDRNSATWTLPAVRSKNGEANIVPLNSQAMAALDRLAGTEEHEEPQWPKKGLVLTTTGKTSISGYSRAKSRLDAAMLKLARKEAEARGDEPGDVELVPWRLHDARRTLATGLQKLGVRFEVTEAVLNHTAGASRSGVAAVYQRHGWGPEKRAALDAWASYCDGLLKASGPNQNVVPIRTVKNSPGARAR